MSVLGFTLDNLSMMALILSIGFVVDDAIVMLENIVRHIEHGEQPFEAALKGSREIGFTILSMTVSLAAVFIPILFMSGILGRLFREFAITITAAILISGIVSVTLTPMLCSRFLRAASLHAKGRLRAAHGAPVRSPVPRATNGASATSCDTGPRCSPCSSSCSAPPVEMYGVVPKGFIPDQDNDSLNVNVQAAQGTSYYEMVDYVNRIAGISEHEPIRRHVLRQHGRRLRVDESGAIQPAADAARVSGRCRPAKSPSRFVRSCSGSPASARS